MSAIQNQPFTPHSVRSASGARGSRRSMASEGIGGSSPRRTVYVQVPRDERPRYDGQIVSTAPALISLRFGQQ